MAEFENKPDPTVLTTQQLDKAIGSVREIIEARLTGIENVLAILQKGMETLPESCLAEVQALEALHEEKFNGIKTQIIERDIQAEKASRDVKSAVDAAFAAAKEAVSEQNKSNALSITKSEAAFTKQLDGVNALIITSTATVEGKINDIKERLTMIESHKKGVADGWGIIVGVTSLMIALAAVVITILKLN